MFLCLVRLMTKKRLNIMKAAVKQELFVGER
jgi:hypothetical protein